MIQTVLGPDSTSILLSSGLLKQQFAAELYLYQPKWKCLPNGIVVHYFHPKRSFYTKPKGMRGSTTFGPYPGEIWRFHILLIEI